MRCRRTAQRGRELPKDGVGGVSKRGQRHDPRIYVSNTPKREETRRRWIGSRNQVLHFLTDRYHAEEAKRGELGLVRFIDDDYETAQTILASWEVLPREAHVRAEAVLSVLMSLDDLGGD